MKRKRFSELKWWGNRERKRENGVKKCLNAAKSKNDKL